MKDKKYEKRHFGNIQRLPSGKYRARFRHPYKKNTFINAPNTFSLKYDAENWLAMNELNIQRGIWEYDDKEQQKQKNILFNDYAIKHLEQRQLSKITKKRYIENFYNHISNYFLDKRIQDIKRTDIISWYETLNKAQYRMCENILMLIKLIFNSAVKDEIIMKSPVDIPNTKRMKKIPTKSDIQGAYIEKSDIKILIAKSPDKWRLMIVLGAFFGLRISEALALTKDDINLNKGLISINKSVHYLSESEGVYIAPPKTYASIRDIPIPNKAIKYIKNHIDLIKNTDKFLFTRPSDNNPVRDVYYRDKIFNNIRQYTHKKHIRYHDLRHTCLTNYARAGATIKDLMAIAGHTKPDIAMIYQETTFTHLTKLANNTTFI